MIVLGILIVFESLFNSLFGILPQPAAPGLTALADNIVSSSFFEHLAWANDYFPLDTVLTASAVVWGAWVVLWVSRLVIYILVKLHILGGSD